MNTQIGNQQWPFDNQQQMMNGINMPRNSQQQNQTMFPPSSNDFSGMIGLNPPNNTQEGFGNSNMEQQFVQANQMFNAMNQGQNQ